MNKIAIALPLILGLTACASVAQPAHAGEWRLNPRLCADTREDIRDARVNRGPRDRAEDRRDQRVVNCPASAFVWVGKKNAARNAAPHFQRIYIDKRGRYYGVKKGSTIRIQIVK